jgi:hypothetical protein
MMGMPTSFSRPDHKLGWHTTDVQAGASERQAVVDNRDPCIEGKRLIGGGDGGGTTTENGNMFFRNGALFR